MRFGKHTLNPLALARRLKAEPQDPVFSPVACEERDALLSSSPAPPQEVTIMPDESGMSGGDPTQRLLTALGRFQRHVARAESGAAQEMWSDECMNQLIVAFEIAKKENWTDVVEALTETARVLQTYEEAGCAHDCVPFLADSYEILCLMVGDLIVGSVRSGVMDKWRRRYDRALDDLNTAGLQLVSDDGAGDGPGAVGGDAIAAASETPPFELPPLEPFDGAGANAEADEGLPTLDDLPPLAVTPAVDEAALQTPAANEDEAVPSEVAAEEKEDIEAEPTSTAEVPGTTMLFDASPGTPEEASGVEAAAPESPGQDPETAEKPGISPELAEVLDKLCECLSRLENHPSGERHETAVALEYSLTFLQRYAQDSGRAGAVELCREMEKICRLALGKSGHVEDRFFELAYAFCGAYVDANSGTQDPIVINWVEECESLVEQWRAAKTEDEPEAVVPGPAGGFVEGLEDGSPERLLETAHRAAESGNTTDAKLLALQAAVNIARGEAEEAARRVEGAETRLKEAGQAIEAAHTGVREAERSVSETQTQVAGAESELATRRSAVAGVEQTLTESDERISQLEDQLRAVQTQLDGEVQRKGQTLSELAEARRLEAETQAQLEGGLSEEDAARIRLEHARQEVKRVQQKRSEMEAALERTRDVLTRRRTSLAEIEHTIEDIRGASEPDEPDDQDLLF